jgi:hypothetical protein
VLTIVQPAVATLRPQAPPSATRKSVTPGQCAIAS